MEIFTGMFKLCNRRGAKSACARAPMLIVQLTGVGMLQQKEASGGLLSGEKAETTPPLATVGFLYGLSTSCASTRL